MRFLAFPLHSRPWCNGSTADSKPVSQGSNPWERAQNGVRGVKAARLVVIQEESVRARSNTLRFNIFLKRRVSNSVLVPRGYIAILRQIHSLTGRGSVLVGCRQQDKSV